jgi:hypothetical protein
MIKFSSVTLIELVDALPLQTNAAIEEFAMRFDLEECVRESGMEKKLLSIKRYLKDNPEMKGPLGSPLVQEVFEYMLERKFAWAKKHGQDIDLGQLPASLLIALRRDGYTTDGLTLIPLLPTETDLEQVESELEFMLSSSGFSVAKEHLRQGRDDFVRGNWAAANGCFRSAVESLLIGLANQRGARQVEKGGTAIGSLAQASEPLVHERLNEWDGQGKGFMEGFWKRLHPEGPHPGLSDEEDCTFRMQLVMVVMHYLLLQNRRCP